MKPLLPLLFSLLCIGCSNVAVVEPLGTPIPDPEAEAYSGIWLDGKKNIYDVSYDAASDTFTITNSDTPEKSNEFTVRKLDSEITVLWTEPSKDGQKLFFPFRAAPSMTDGEKAIAFLPPDTEHIQAQIKAGTLKGEKLEENLWLLRKEGLEEHLVSKEFWALDNAFIFVKTAESGKADSE